MPLASRRRLLESEGWGGRGPLALGAALKTWVRADTVKGRTAAQFTAANSETLSRADAAIWDWTNKFTWAGWVYFDAVNVDQALFSKWAHGSNTEICIQLSSTGKLRVFIAKSSNDAGANADDAAALSATTWYHIAVVYDGAGANDAAKLKVYVNAVERTLGAFSATPIPTTLQNTTAVPTFGSFTGSLTRYFGGRMENVGIWTAALSAANITSLYNGGTGVRYSDAAVSYTGLIGWWEMDEESGTRADKSGNALTLTDNNTVTSNDGKVSYAVTADGSVVAIGTDQGTAALVIQQATHTKKPLLKTGVINSQSVLRFDGTDDFLNVATGAISNQPFWGWCVVDDNDAATRYYLDGGAASKVSLFHDGTNLNANAGSSVGAAHTAGAPHLVTFIVNGASSDIRVDGTSIATGDAGAQNQDSGVAVGSDNAGASPLQGDIAEFAFVAGSPTVTDLRNLKDYINSRYNLSVA